MALTQAHKDVVGGMNDIDKALLMLYIGGHDDSNKAVILGDALIAVYWPHLIEEDAVTNELRARAIVKASDEFWVNHYDAYKANQAETRRIELLEEAAIEMNAENPLDDMPAPEAP